MWNFLGQGSKMHHTSDLNHCSDNARTLTHCTTRELHFSLSWVFWWAEVLNLDQVYVIIFSFMVSALWSHFRNLYLLQAHTVSCVSYSKIYILAFTFRFAIHFKLISVSGMSVRVKAYFCCCFFFFLSGCCVLPTSFILRFFFLLELIFGIFVIGQVTIYVWAYIWMLFCSINLFVYPYAYAILYYLPL